MLEVHLETLAITMLRPTPLAHTLTSMHACHMQVLNVQLTPSLETPAYSVLRAAADYELRRYDPYTVGWSCQPACHWARGCRPWWRFAMTACRAPMRFSC